MELAQVPPLLSSHLHLCQKSHKDVVQPGQTISAPHMHAMCLEQLKGHAVPGYLQHHKTHLKQRGEYYGTDSCIGHIQGKGA